MRTAKAKPISKPKPGSVAAIRRRVADLKIATALVKGAKAIERELAVPNTPIDPIPSNSRSVEWETQLVKLGRRVPELLEELSKANTALADARARFNETAPLPPRPRKRAKDGPKRRLFKGPIIKIVRGAPVPARRPMEVTPAHAYEALRDAMMRDEGELTCREIYQISDRFRYKFMAAGRDCGLDDAITRSRRAGHELREIAAQAFSFTPRTRLGLAGQAIALCAAGAAGNVDDSKYSGQLAFNLLEVEAQLNDAFGDAFGRDSQRPLANGVRGLRVWRIA